MTCSVPGMNPFILWFSSSPCNVCNDISLPPLSLSLSLLLPLSCSVQCCIDDDFDMVKTLVRLGSNVDQQDKEGWTPLHAAASCGNTHIVR